MSIGFNLLIVMTLSQEDQQAVSQALEKIYAITDLDGYVVTCMEVLPGLIDADVGAYNEVNYEARRIVSLTDSPEVQQLYHERQQTFERLLFQNPLIEHDAQVRDGPKRISDFITQEQWQRRRLYQDAYRFIDANYQVAVALTLESPSIIAFAFNRAQSDFIDRDLDILSVLQPHLTIAYQNALTHSRNLDRIQSREDTLSALGIGWLDLDANYAVSQAAPEVLQTIRSFFMGSVLAESESDRLPRPVEDWVDAQSRELRKGVPPSSFVTSMDDRRLTISLVVGPNGETSLMADVFLLQASPEMLQELGIGKRQAQVLYWVSQGKSNSEIAVILKITVSTVENHIHRILDLLKASNRTQAAQLAQAHLQQARRSAPSA
ncbi:MAG: LuxR C-terminal-related transcriptional regulator [Pseudomonadota bacterium]